MTKRWQSGNCFAWAVAIALGILVFGVALGMFSEHRQVRRLTENYDPPGQMIDIGLHQLHLFCEGTGGPPVLFEAGSGLAYINWQKIQSELSSITTVCSYDRSGLGWSQPGTAAPSANQATDELAALLSRSGISGPWILVGHSLGGLYVQHFTNRYTDKVAALVLLDSAHEDDFDQIPRFVEVFTPGVLESLTTFASFLGIHRLGRPNVPESDATWIGWQLHATSKHVRAAAAEWWSIPSSARQVRDTGSGWGSIPLIVVGAGRRDWPDDWTAEEKSDAAEKLVLMDKVLAGRSTGGQCSFLEESGHGIPWERPDIVISAVRSTIIKLRETQY